MQQKTFGKKGRPMAQRTGRLADKQRPLMHEVSAMERPRGSVPPDYLSGSTEAPNASGFYIPEAETKQKSFLGGVNPTGYQNLVGLVVLFSIVAVIVAMCQPSSVERERAAALSAQNRTKGFHCLSAWNGSHLDFVGTVKRAMRDPNSFEHIKTVITPVKDGKHTVVMDYRARNGFGGMNTGVAVGVVSNADCKLLEWSTV